MKETRALAVPPELAASILEHMAVVSDPLRCRMLLTLERHELTVTELCAVVQLPQSTVSRHLKTLADAGWVTTRRDGTRSFYSAAVEDLDAGAQRLWPLVREQLSLTSGAAQDARRLESVLARRQSKSAAFFSSASGQWDRLRRDLFGETFHLHALLGLLGRDLVVGDLGCGTGEIAALLAPHVRQVLAVDGSADMLQAARRRLKGAANVTFRRGALEALPIADGELDVAILALVLHHAPDPARTLAEAARALRPGGRLLLVDMLPHDRVEYQQQMGHVWLGFPEGQVQKLVTSAGFGAVRLHALPVDPAVKGPALFAAYGERRASAPEPRFPE
ncbi:MAG: metalloregulator ArsR/SmtB family transcription factor [Acidobacteriota bacterium]